MYSAKNTISSLFVTILAITCNLTQSVFVQFEIMHARAFVLRLFRMTALHVTVAMPLDPFSEAKTKVRSHVNFKLNHKLFENRATRIKTSRKTNIPTRVKGDDKN